MSETKMNGHVNGTDDHQTGSYALPQTHRDVSTLIQSSPLQC